MIDWTDCVCFGILMGHVITPKTTTMPMIEQNTNTDRNGLGDSCDVIPAVKLRVSTLPLTQSLPLAASKNNRQADTSRAMRHPERFGSINKKAIVKPKPTFHSIENRMLGSIHATLCQVFLSPINLRSCGPLEWPRRPLYRPAAEPTPAPTPFSGPKSRRKICRPPRPA